MEKKRFEIGAGGVLELLAAHDDLAIKGWDEDVIEVSLDGDWAACAVETQPERLAIDSQAPLSVSAPAGIVVRVGVVSGDLALSDLGNQIDVQQVVGDCSVKFCAAQSSISMVRGDLHVEQLTGMLEVGEVKSDVRLTDMGAQVTFGRVGGDFRVQGLDGALQVGMVQGDARVRDVSGAVEIEQVQGDFKGTDMDGGMEVHALGDLAIKTDLTPGANYVGHAQGDISARVPPNASAQFTLQAHGGISTRLLKVEKADPNCVQGRMGDGEAQVTLKAGGHLALKPRGGSEGDWAGFGAMGAEFGAIGAEFGRVGAEFGESIAAQVEAQVAEQLGEMNFDELARVEMEKVMSRLQRDLAKIQRKAQEHSRRAEELARKAREKARRGQARAQRAAQRQARRMHGSGRKHAGRRARPKVSPEEQMSILTMLQEGQITPQEAEVLLKALEE